MQIRKWDEQRQKIFLDRYAKKNEKGEPIENNVEDMWSRVATAIGSNNTEITEFYKLLNDFKFVPGGRILAGAGTKDLKTYFNCFVLPIEPNQEGIPIDSRESILDTFKNIIEINCRGGGVGLNWSAIRPQGAYVKGVNGKSSGVVGWARGLDGLAERVEQGGSRQAALMFVLDVWHPDILNFIEAKKTEGVLNNANFSVNITDEFMKAVTQNEDWHLIFPDTSHERYDELWDGDVRKWLIHGLPIVKYKTIKARELWEKICYSAWENGGEPGVVFLDQCNIHSNTRYIEKIKAVNVCGEQPLPDWGVCNLGSINLVAHINENGDIDWSKLRKTIHDAVLFLDRVIDESVYVTDKMKQKQIEQRRIGLGTMGLADALLLEGLTYGSEESLNWIDAVYFFIQNEAYRKSIQLAQELGPAPAYDRKFLDSPFIKRLPSEIQKGIQEHGIRNLTLLTQAPTGTTSILAGVSSGIEPVFSWSYRRRDHTGEHVVEHPLYAKYKQQGDDIPAYFVSSHDVTPFEHVNVQAKIQAYVDSSISKTINAPNEHDKESVPKLFRTAYALGCKGITYYRDGTRSGVLIKEESQEEQNGADENIDSDQKGQEKLKEWPPKTKERPKTLSGKTAKWKTPLGNILVTLNFDRDGKPFEALCQLGKNGSEVLAFTEAIGRLISICLRSGVSIDTVIYHLSGIGGPQSMGFGPQKVRSVPDAIAQSLNYLIEGNGDIDSDTLNICPDCKSGVLTFEEGCFKCNNCDHTGC